MNAGIEIARILIEHEIERQAEILAAHQAAIERGDLAAAEIHRQEYLSRFPESVARSMEVRLEAGQDSFGRVLP